MDAVADPTPSFNQSHTSVPAPGLRNFKWKHRERARPFFSPSVCFRLFINRPTKMAARVAKMVGVTVLALAEYLVAVWKPLCGRLTENPQPDTDAAPMDVELGRAVAGARPLLSVGELWATL